MIRARRKQLGLDQRTLAERIGVSRQWLVEVEKGKPRAELGLVLRALHALELAIDVGTEAPKSSAANVPAGRPRFPKTDLSRHLQLFRGPLIEKP